MSDKNISKKYRNLKTGRLDVRLSHNEEIMLDNMMRRTGKNKSELVREMIKKEHKTN